MVKKWYCKQPHSLSTLPSRITDAFNNARDRVRYLESLAPHLKALQASPASSLSSIASDVLPALVGSVRQMEGLSRAYARSGYLGILFTKVIGQSVWAREVASVQTMDMIIKGPCLA